MIRAFEAHSCPHRSRAGRSRSPFFRAFHALAVDDGSGRAGSVSTRAKADFRAILLRQSRSQYWKTTFFYFQASLKLLVAVGLARMLTDPLSATTINKFLSLGMGGPSWCHKSFC